ncbi:putative UDP-Glycosyltransferase superfamily protein [Hibiscus syriacus]|uniref:UDP-Glycosyltransferase superfamily protein n=1 Tax=Hibiscus syriacus TaxID=106335 RepID=A0A6A2WAY6_HIBSY|nr:putative UDP-Glycosyltransferase superfamily protein [Hibiscus syriacus]
MESSSSICHVVPVPYPGRGHVNPMMNPCKLLCSKTSNILITFVVTEEWLGFISSDKKPFNVRFRTIPNVGPSELVRALPCLLRSCPHSSPRWKLHASTGATKEYSGGFPLDHRASLEPCSGLYFINAESTVSLFTSVYELESHVIDAFNERLPFPVYAIDPSVPYLDLKEHSSTTTSLNGHGYLQWLDMQPKAGVQDSGVRYLWVSRGDSSRIKDGWGDGGLVIPWCDQLRVLCHS